MVKCPSTQISNLFEGEIMIQKNMFHSNTMHRSINYPGMPSTDFADFLVETDQFIQGHPEILEAIEKDLDKHAREKKKLRIQDEMWKRKQKAGEDIEGEMNLEVQEDQLRLEEGRPRTSGYVVFIALVCRGYHPRGMMSRSFQDFLYESRSLEVLLRKRGETLPAAKTLWELLEGVRNKTRYKIHLAQCDQIIKKGLDNFEEMILDSTHVSANSAWPTDAGIILKLLERIWRNGNKLEEFGYENFRRHWTETWIEKIKKALYKINTTNHKSTRKKQYKRIYHFAEQAGNHLEDQRKKFEDRYKSVNHPPSEREQIKEIRGQLKQDLHDVMKVISYSRKRVLAGESTSSTEKILSVGGDEDAAYITKGSRDPIIGYRPQIARSQNGFIGNFSLPKGNANDAKQLTSMVEGWEEGTGVWPDVVSTDDGYADGEAVEEIEKEGTEVVSVSGAKGKKILGEEKYESQPYREARRRRSTVESTIYVQKHVYGFGEASRRGIESVRAELTEDVIAHNFFRMVQRKREQKKQREQKDSEAA